jgi:hypothetical protein
MEFFSTAIDTLANLVTLIGAGLAAWGVVNLMEGYGNDNPGAKSQGMKQTMAGIGIALVAQLLIPQLTTLFTA